MPTNFGDTIVIEDNIDDNESGGGAYSQELEWFETLRRSGKVKPARFDRDVLDDEDRKEEIKFENGDYNNSFQFVDLTEGCLDDQPDTGRRAAQVGPSAAKQEARQQPPPEQELLEYTTDRGIKLQKGTTIELAKPIGRWDISFLKIEAIIREYPTGTVTLRGLPYARSRSMRGILPRKLNEVCLIVQLSDDDHRSWREQAIITVPPRQVVGIRELRSTNSLFPEHRFTGKEFLKRGKQWLAEFGHLVCRCRAVWHYSSQTQKDQDKAYEWSIVYFVEDEADEAYRVRAEHLVNQWRGGKTVGGAYFPDKKPTVTIDLEDSKGKGPAEEGTLVPGQRYLAGDTFCGSGGASRGMERAGIHVGFAVDHWPCAVRSYRSNFLETSLFDLDIEDFITGAPMPTYPDFLHLSPPCQVWSPAHTVIGKDDDKNIASLFSCEDLISKCKPRIFTLEQTFGMLRQTFELYFNMLVYGFTVHGYSVRWKILHLKNYGLPQPRRRLIMIGAGPGETLPPFPKPTHSSATHNGLLPLVTVKDCLAGIDRFKDHPLHNPDELLKRARNRPPKRKWDPNLPLPFTITCSGGQNYHWDGARDLTLLEFAMLQGFPSWHRFQGPYIKKQIGNAFPPTIVRVLYEYLSRWLDQQDGVKGTRQPPGILGRRDVTVIEDEDPERTAYTAQLRELNNLTKVEDWDFKMPNFADMGDGEEGEVLSDDDTLSIKSEGTLTLEDDIPRSRDSSPGFEMLSGPPPSFPPSFASAWETRKRVRDEGGNEASGRDKKRCPFNALD